MMSRLRQIIFMFSIAIFCASCRTADHSSALQRFEFQQPHMGTMFTIILYASDADAARMASTAAFEKIAALERVMTDYDPESELMRLCQTPVGRAAPVSAELFEVLEKSQRVAELSNGAFDATVGPVIRLWRRTRRTAELPAPQMLASARAAVGWQNLKLNRHNHTLTLLVPHMQLDLGGIGKGFAADKALQVLQSHGVERALIAASGDIAVSGPPPGKAGWRVSIGAPDFAFPELDPESKTNLPIVRTLLLKHASVSTAGDSEQFVDIGGVRYSHIVDPRTGIGLTNQLQVSVIAPRATDTDAFDTTARVLGVEQGMKLIERQPQLAALILYLRDGKLQIEESKRFRRLPRAN
jgi:FAD:protein FMN transferase